MHREQDGGQVERGYDRAQVAQPDAHLGRREGQRCFLSIVTGEMGRALLWVSIPELLVQRTQGTSGYSSGRAGC